MFGQFKKKKNFKIHKGAGKGGFSNMVEKISTEMNNHSITTSPEITKEGKRLFGSKFKGTFSQDTVPHFKEDAFFIFNTDTHEKAGVHWLAGVYKKAEHKYYIYDTYSRNISSLIPVFIKQHNADSEITSSKHKIDEALDGKDCAQRSLTWLKLHEKKFS